MGLGRQGRVAPGHNGEKGGRVRNRKKLGKGSKRSGVLKGRGRGDGPRFIIEEESIKPVLRKSQDKTHRSQLTGFIFNCVNQITSIHLEVIGQWLIQLWAKHIRVPKHIR